MQDKIIMLVIVLIIGFAGGWCINGWRLSGKIEHMKAVEADNIRLIEAVNVQNARIMELEHEGEHRKKLAEKAVKAATEANRSLENQLTILRATNGATCDEANELLNKVIQ
jgi:hypothetical protein